MTTTKKKAVTVTKKQVTPVPNKKTPHKSKTKELQKEVTLLKEEMTLLRKQMDDMSNSNKRKRSLSSSEIDMDEEEKECTSCNEYKSLASFQCRGGTNKKKARSTGRSVCFSCINKKYRLSKVDTSTTTTKTIV